MMLGLGGADSFAFTRLLDGTFDRIVDFDAADGQAVDLVFAMAVPDHYTHEHLMLLSELAERFSDARFRTALRNAPDAQSMRKLLLDQPLSPKAAA